MKSKLSGYKLPKKTNEATIVFNNDTSMSFIEKKDEIVIRMTDKGRRLREVNLGEMLYFFSHHGTEWEAVNSWEIVDNAKKK